MGLSDEKIAAKWPYGAIWLVFSVFRGILGLWAKNPLKRAEIGVFEGFLRLRPEKPSKKAVSAVFWA